MKDNTVLAAFNLKKRFKIFHSPVDILKEWITLGRRSFHKDFWALDDISFKISKGEFVGIIGPNGAGKSTLLRIITDVLRPTSGSYFVNGRVLSILELTGGTDKDLTGRENVIRSGQLMGFPDGYVLERMDVIKDFSELGDFFDQPLRVYSTGMKTRLSFSMFAFMDTDVLILDEVLAVGDIFFKQKCFTRLSELLERNTTIILVTHSMGIVQRYCQRVILLNKGKKIYDGGPGDAIKLYLQVRGEQPSGVIKKLMADEEGYDLIPDHLDVPSMHTPGDTPTARPDFWPGDEVFKFHSFPKITGKARAAMKRLAVLNDDGEPTLIFKQGETLHIYCEFQLKRDIGMPVINVEIRDKFNLLVHSKNTVQNHTYTPAAASSGDVIHYYQAVGLGFAPGNYVINLECSSVGKDPQKLAQKEKPLLNHHMDTERVWRLEGAFAIAVLPIRGVHHELLHGGLCDQPGSGVMQVVSTGTL